MTSKLFLLTGRRGSLTYYVSCKAHSYLTFLVHVFNFSDRGVSAGVIAGGVAGGVTATAVLVLCCIVFAVVYLRKKKQPVSIG